MSREDYELVQAVLAGNRAPAGLKARSLMTNLARCGVCEGPMIAKYSTSKGVRQRFSACAFVSQGLLPSDGQRHVAVLGDMADQAVAEALLRDYAEGRLAGAEPTESEAADLRAIGVALAENARQAGQLNEVAMMPGATLTDIAKRLRTLQAEAEDLNRQRVAIRSEAASGNWKHEWLSQFGDVVPSYADAVVRSVEFLAHWNGLPLEQRRDIIQSTYQVTVVKGRKGAKRVKVELV